MLAELLRELQFGGGGFLFDTSTDGAVHLVGQRSERKLDDSGQRW